MQNLDLGPNDLSIDILGTNPVLAHEGLSCDPRRLYGSGGLIDKSVSRARLVAIYDAFAGEIETLFELFPSSPTIRPPPFYMEDVGGTPARHHEQAFLDVQRHIPIAPASIVVKIRKAILWNNMVFAVRGDEIIPIYENYRQCDQFQVGKDAAAPLKGFARMAALPTDAPVLFVGSAGSFNYGHWLIDDFPRYKAVRELSERGIQARIAYTEFSPKMNEVRRDALHIVSGSEGALEPLVLQTDQPVLVENLYYATPVSYQPFGKNDHALTFLKTLGRTMTAVKEPSDKLFVNRRREWQRAISNGDEVRKTLCDAGFVEIFPEDMSLSQQIGTFKDARVAVGILGAAMSNTIFMPSVSSCHYLCASSWPEPFFWDLTQVGAKQYGTLFGKPEEGDAPSHLKNFEVDCARLAARINAGIDLSNVALQAN